MGKNFTIKKTLVSESSLGLKLSLGAIYLL